MVFITLRATVKNLAGEAGTAVSLYAKWNYGTTTLPTPTTDGYTFRSWTADLMDIIRLIRDKFNVTILLIEHDMKFVSGLCDELTVLNFGTVLAQGDTKTALSDPEVIRAYIGG